MTFSLAFDMTFSLAFDMTFSLAFYVAVMIDLLLLFF
jgi:hypothetical protein